MVADAKMEVERYFRLVDRAVFDHVSRDADSPLVLAGIPELQATFRSLSENPHLVAEGIPKGVSQQADAEFLAQAWSCVEPHHAARQEKILEDYAIAKSRAMTSDDVRQIAKALSQGRVGTLLVEADRTIPGRFELETGHLITSERMADANDLLDDFAETVLRTDGRVLILPAERMPVTTGIATTFRFDL